MMKVLIVTGGIGSGKSVVCRMLTESFGIPVYDADRRAKSLYSEVPSLLSDIEREVGADLKDESGAFVSHKLAEIIFKDSAALKVVEDIVFPYLKEDFSIWAKCQAKDVVAFESATVLEKSQFDGFGDVVLLVDAPKALRLSRACSRDVQDEMKIIERMNAQPLMNMISDGGTSDRVDHVILNDSSLDDLQLKLSDFIEKYWLTKMLSV